MIKSIGATVSFAQLGEDQCVIFTLNSDLRVGSFHQVYLQLSKALIYLLEVKSPDLLILDRDYLHQQLLLQESIKGKNTPLLLLLFTSNTISTKQTQKIVNLLKLSELQGIPWALFTIRTQKHPREDLNKALNWLKTSLNFINAVKKIQKFKQEPFHDLLHFILPHETFLMNPDDWLADSFGNDFLFFKMMTMLLFKRFLEVSLNEFDEVASLILEHEFKTEIDHEMTLNQLLPPIEPSNLDNWKHPTEPHHVQGGTMQKLTSFQKTIESFIDKKNDHSFLDWMAKRLSWKLKYLLNLLIMSTKFEKELTWYADVLNSQMKAHVPYLKFFFLQEFLPRIFFKNILTPRAMKERLQERWNKIPWIKQLRRLYSKFTTIELLIAMIENDYKNWKMFTDKGKAIILKTQIKNHMILLRLSFDFQSPELQVELRCPHDDVQKHEPSTFTFVPCIITEDQGKILYSSQKNVLNDYLLSVAKINLLLTYFSAVRPDASIIDVARAVELIHPDIIEQFVHSFGKCRHFNWPLRY